jgi:dephospho-CoA kinase
MPEVDKPVIGLTGGIASGKSTVAQMLRAQGVEVVDADAIAREVVAPGSDGLREVVATFGPAVLASDGALDRPKLAEIVFADAQARARLNAILHPRIGQLSAERIAAAGRTDTPYVVYEAPLLVETGAHRGLSALIVVAAAEPAQLARMMKRDLFAEHAARERLAAQLPLSAKVKEADYVIDNDGDIEALRANTLRVHGAIRQRFLQPSSEA